MTARQTTGMGERREIIPALPGFVGTCIAYAVKDFPAGCATMSGRYRRDRSAQGSRRG